jgi:hypothetical protein
MKGKNIRLCVFKKEVPRRRETCKTLVGRLKDRDHFVDVGVDGKPIRTNLRDLVH